MIDQEKKAAEQEEKVVYHVYEHEVRQMMKDRNIPITDETLPRAIDQVADFLNQTLRDEAGFYLEYQRAEIEGEADDN